MNYIINIFNFIHYTFFMAKTTPRTAGWSAPELSNEGEKASKQTDAYSLGLVLTGILTKQKPWKDLTSEIQIIDLVRNGELPPQVKEIKENWAKTQVKGLLEFDKNKRLDIGDVRSEFGKYDRLLKIVKSESMKKQAIQKQAIQKRICNGIRSSSEEQIRSFIAEPSEKKLISLCTSNPNNSYGEPKKFNQFLVILIALIMVLISLIVLMFIFY